MKLGQELAELTAGIDRLYRADRGRADELDREGLIPVAMASVTPRPLRDWSDALDGLTAFRDRIPADAESAHRAGWLNEMTLSLMSLTRMFSGQTVPFRDRLRDQLRVAPEPVSQRILDGYRADLRDALTELGHDSGDLAQDVAAWEDATRVPADQVLARLAAFQREARARSARLVLDIGDDWIEPRAVHDRPYAAYCDYPGRTLWFNLEFTYTEASLKYFATHEACPGHLVHMSRREALVARGEMPLDGAQVVTNSASSALFEGIAENGIELLDWVDGPADIAGLALQRTRSALRCNAAWMVFEEGASVEDAARATAAPSFLPLQTTRRRLAFLSHDLRAPFLYAYWAGDHAVRQFLDASADRDRSWVIRELYDRMHTPGTLAATL